MVLKTYLSISYPSNPPEVSNVMAQEETALGEKSDRQRQENNEPDADTPDGFLTVALTGQRRAQEKHRYNTIGYQVLGSYCLQSMLHTLNRVCIMHVFLFIKSIIS